MSRRSLLSPPLLALAALCLSSLVPAQNSAYGKWVTDPNNRATAAFVYDPPPAGFDPLAASDVELEQYGFPPRPGRGEAERYGDWKKMVTAKRITPELRPTFVYNGLPEDWTGGTSGVGTTQNWSGFAFGVPEGTFAASTSHICAKWIVPAVQQAVCSSSTTDYSSQWVGFDGGPNSTSSDIPMAGTVANASCGRHNKPAPTYSAFVEWFPAAATEVSGLTISPGDGVYVCVFYVAPSPPTPQFALATISDLTTDAPPVFLAFYPPAGTTFVGDSAEWVMGRPTVGGALADLPNFGYFAFDNGAATNTSSVTYAPGARLRGVRGVTSAQITMVCPPWIPSTSCNGRRGATPISGFNLTVGSENYNTLWFTTAPPAAP